MTANELSELLVPRVGLVLERDLPTSSGVLPAGRLVAAQYRAGLGGVSIFANPGTAPVHELAGPNDLARHGVRLPSADDERRELSRLRAAGEL